MKIHILERKKNFAQEKITLEEQNVHITIYKKCNVAQNNDICTRKNQNLGDKRN